MQVNAKIRSQAEYKGVIVERNGEKMYKCLGVRKQMCIRDRFHYVPLHSAKAGQKYGEFVGEDVYTTTESERLLRLPMYYGLKKELSDYIIECIKGFFY